MSFNFQWFARKKKACVEKEAYRWVVRKDAGLKATDEEELEKRKSEDPEFAKALEKSTTAWQMLDHLPPQLAFGSHSEKKVTPLILRPIWRECAIAAVFLIGLTLIWQLGFQQAKESGLYYTETRSTFDPWTQRLPDGSIIRLNVDTKVEVNFTPKFRQIKLLQGEAHFTVANSPERPFRVLARSVKVQAVGTVFNVRLRTNKVDVLVTEGTVEVAPNKKEPEQVSVETEEPSPEIYPYRSLVTSGQSAEVLFQPDTPEKRLDIADIDSAAIDKTLAWQKALLTFGGDSLDVIAASFEQKTGVKLIIADPELHSLRIGGKFPSEDIKGFLNVLESGYGIQWSENKDGTLVIGDSH